MGCCCKTIKHFVYVNHEFSFNFEWFYYLFAWCYSPKPEMKCPPDRAVAASLYTMKWPSESCCSYGYLTNNGGMFRLIYDLEACRLVVWFHLERATSLSDYRWRSNTDHAVVLVTCQTVGCLFRLIYDLEPCRLAVCFHLDRATSLTFTLKDTYWS